ncbi:hypothetical protein GCM10009119_29070 [Algoriphagus jejuensis]|uniref:Uncharacterized protein n=1 Tax=Algoriphagus jejuensis TaxID=419934 RepID=A0ABN1N2R3_9BACT
MKAIAVFLKKTLMTLAAICSLFACDLDDAPDTLRPSNVLTKYVFPPEIVEQIFTEDVLEVTGSLEPFLDRIKRNGMKIYDGHNPPVVYNPYSSGELEGVQFRVKNDCIYDEKYPSYADSTFGDYLDQILILEKEKDVVEAIISYSSLSNDPKYPDRLDSGNGEGIATGEGDDFTVFYKVERGQFDKIFYQGIWIVSGTFTFGENLQPILSNVSKCLILLEKSSDPDQKMANVGTIRIFQDPAPIWQD